MKNNRMPRISRSRAKQLVWWAFLAGLTAGLVFAYQRWVLSASGTSFTWTREGIVYQLMDPRALGLFLVAPLVLLGASWSLADLPWQQRILSAALRLSFVALLALALARLVQTAETHKICSVFLVDVSDSVPDEALVDARAQIEEALRAKPPEDRLKVVTFARRPQILDLGPETGEQRLPEAKAFRHLPAPPAPSGSSTAGAAPHPGAGSDLASALRLAYGLFPPGYLKRAVLLTDGVETEGDALAEASRARDLGVKVFVTPYRRPAPGEIAVRELRLPDKVQIGQPFEVIADLYASRASRARVRLFQGEALNGLDGARELDLHPGSNEITFKSVVRLGGEVTYRIDLDPLTQDHFKENNSVSSTLEVPGRPQVLYVEGQPARASYLQSALGAQQFDVDVRPPGSFPGSLKELERYDFVVLSDVPREAISLGAQELIEQYVRDLGGGLLFAGGQAGFGLGGWGGTTIERILPVRMDAERRKEMPSVAMVLIIDRSGSMTGIPLEMAKAACRATVSTLQGDDLIEIIAFDSEATRYVKMQPAKYRARIETEIARIQPGGGTEIFPALDMGYQDISVVQARKKHVILLTDGRAPTQGLRDLVQAMISENVTVTTVGLGDQTDQELLRALSELGGGRFHFVPDPNSLPKIFTRETELISRQAAVEEWFPVEQVFPAAFLKGLAVNSAPLLHGYVATQLKPPPAQLILQSDRGEPILARWRVGLGQTLAWTSDLKNLWAVDWLRWPGWSPFWGQLVREHMRQKQRTELPMKTEVIGNTVHALVDAFTVDERFDNNMVSQLTVIGAETKGKPRQIPMKQTAPGRYEARFDLDRYGSFVLHAEHAKEDAKTGELRPMAVSYGHIQNPYPREYASFEPDLERMKQIASAGGGRVDPPPAVLFDPGDEKLLYHQDLFGRFVGAAIGIFLLDLLVRRVRLFDRKFLPKRVSRPKLK